MLGIHFIPNPYNYTEIDHIDKNKINNSLDNLRWIDKSGNCRNTKNNRKYDLPRGVSKTPNNKYQVNIRIKGEKKHLGRYDTIEEASEVYENKYNELMSVY